jgi:hypothetical protein
MFYEPSVEIGEPKEGLDIFNVSWLGPFLYRGDLCWVHFCSTGRNDEA